eukprot:TRINITY_DN75550_c0_g1_i1.p1 TRINITY_DN75550_c0_g1~~TRINITY_DN75550_c0_g1_i1.p1  ORF type:complete len:241 (-),score=26.01 TRINITY_DN75550_c0_g1_i1:462-1184(-)
MWGAELSLTNKALQYLAVATRTMINATNVLFMMISAWLWGLERLGILRLASAFTLIIGGVCQGLDKHSSGTANHFTGVLMQMASIIFATQRWALLQTILQLSPKDSALAMMTKTQIMARVIPVTGVVAFGFALVWEPQAYSLANLMHHELWVNMLVVSAACTLMQYAELKLVHMISFVAFNVLSTVHQIPIVLAGVILQDNSVGKFSGLGFGVCVVGALIYARARWIDASQRVSVASSEL